MSLLRSIRQQLGLMSGGNESQNHFWDGSVANQLTLKRGVPDAPGAEIIKVLNGVLSFPNQGQSLTSPGYIKLPGGLIIQWGIVAGVASGTTIPVTFPIPFKDAGSYTPMVTVDSGAVLSTNIAFVSRVSGSVMDINSPSPTAINVHWLAVGWQ